MGLPSYKMDDLRLIYGAAEFADEEFTGRYRRTHNSTIPKTLDIRDLYVMLIKGQARMSILLTMDRKFNVVFMDSIESGLKEKHWTLVDLFESMHYEGFDTFMEVAGKSNRLHNLLQALPDAQRKSLLAHYVGEMDDGHADFSRQIGSAMFDTIEAIREPEIAVFIENGFRHRCKRY